MCPPPPCAAMLLSAANTNTIGGRYTLPNTFSDPSRAAVASAVLVNIAKSASRPAQRHLAAIQPKRAAHRKRIAQRLLSLPPIPRRLRRQHRRAPRAIPGCSLAPCVLVLAARTALNPDQSLHRRPQHTTMPPLSPR